MIPLCRYMIRSTQALCSIKLSLKPLEAQTCIRASKAKAVRQHDIDLLILCGQRDIIEFEFRSVEGSKVERWRDNILEKQVSGAKSEKFFEV